MNPRASSSIPASSSPISRVFGVRPAATRMSDALDRPLARRRLDAEAHSLPGSPFDGLCLGPEHDVDAILFEHREDGRGHVRILTAEKLRPELQNRDLTAEPAERLRELHPHISAAEHNQVRREPVELQRFDMRQRPSVGETRDARDRRAGAEIQKQAVGDEAARAAFSKSRLDRARPHKDAFGKEELEMRDRELPAVDRDHAVDHLALALAYSLHVHRRRVDTHAVRRGAPDQIGDLGAADHVLARQAGDVRTRSANQGALDHHDGPALLRQVPGDILARLTPAEDDVLDVYGLSHGGPQRLG